MIFGVDAFNYGQSFNFNDTYSLKGEHEIFSAGSNRPHPGTWDGTEVLYDSTQTSTLPQIWTDTQRASIRIPSSGAWNSSSHWYIGVYSISSGYLIYIWNAPNPYPVSGSTTGTPNIVIDYSNNAKITSVPYQAIASALGNGKIKDTPVSSPTINCSSQGWRGHFIKDTLGNCGCISGVKEVDGGTIIYNPWTGVSGLIPQGEIWCIIDDTKCHSQQIKTVNESTMRYECRNARDLDCVVSNWSSWDSCVNGSQSRTRTITTQQQGNGSQCPILTETQLCNKEEETDVKIPWILLVGIAVVGLVAIVA